MGVENNECVIATTRNKDAIKSVKTWVDDLSKEHQSLFVFVDSLINAKTTVFLAPCGSKKGWDVDEDIEVLRRKFIAILEGFKYEDDSSSFDWVEVGYGEFGQQVLRGNCANCYGDEVYCTSV